MDIFESLLKERSQNIKQAVKTTSQTLLGFNNCFSIKTDVDEEYRIVNFYAESLEKLIKEKIIDWPVSIRVISDDIAVIDDERIPEDYYAESYCTVCCPTQYLPPIQRDRYVRKLLREEIAVSDGFITIKSSTEYDLGSTTNCCVECGKKDGLMFIVPVESIKWVQVCEKHKDQIKKAKEN